MKIKERLDSILVTKGYFKSRAKAKYAIDSGNIYVNNIQITKSSKLISEEDKIEVRGETLKYVSRGGLKLEKALNVFEINLSNKICMDIGASTGGFTDVMLQTGAKKVYSVDVGHDQLDEKIKNNKNVVNLEGINIKDIDAKDFNAIDFISTDVSFISILQVIPKIYELLKIKGNAVILIKPQFEVGKQNLNKNGVVKDIKIHKKILESIIEQINKEGFEILNLDYSPIKGPAGNIEYLLYIEKNENNLLDSFKLKNEISKITEEAFKKLK